MTLPNDDPRLALRWTVYSLLIAVSVGAMLGRILAVDSVDLTALDKYRLAAALREKEELFRQRGLQGDALTEAMDRETVRLGKELRKRRPFLSANDRSRWCAVRALVDQDMRVTDAPYAIDLVMQQPGWGTIDMVRHVGPDGKPHFYSSKPPLLSTILAGQYWLIQRVTGATLGTHPYEIGRFLIVVNNVLPLILMLILLAQLVERLGASDFGRLFVMAAACFGTFLTTFAVTINNHIPGAVCATVAVWAAARIWLDGRRRWWCFALAGLAGALTVTNELPSLILLVLLGLGLLVRWPKQTLLFFTPAVLLIAAAYFGTNHLAHGCFQPPYAHRGGENNWYDYTYTCNGRVVESHWRNPTGLDAGEPSNAIYSLHALVGHHGVFSLTPIWLLSAVGVILGLRRREPDVRPAAWLIGAVSVVCLIFFLFIEKDGRNYGGMTSGFRWVFWMAPLWLLAMLPTVDAMSGRRWAQALALVLLAASVLSVSYPTWNPWTHPWLMDYLQYLGCV